MCRISGMMISSAASCTALGEPGMQKTAAPRISPAVARERRTTAEIVRPMHNLEFCANCNRIRITSDGLLKPCLLRTGNEVSLKGKHGEELVSAVAQAVANRSPYFTEEAA